MNFVSTIIVDKKNNKKWWLIGFAIVVLIIIAALVSYKIINKKPTEDTKAVSYTHLTLPTICSV